jgi:hypothetical protein
MAMNPIGARNQALQCWLESQQQTSASDVLIEVDRLMSVSDLSWLALFEILVIGSSPCFCWFSVMVK